MSDIIIAYEDKLLQALKNSSVEALNELLHDDLLFIIPSGETITKAMDIATYSSGKVALQSLEPSDRTIHMLHDTAVVSVTIELKGQYLEQSLNGKFRYLRVWKLFESKWQIIAGSCTPLPV